MGANSPQTVDEYLAAISSEEAQSSLSRLREFIRVEAPDVEEVIRYGIPTYKLHGYVASIAAFKNHCSFFPGHTVHEFADALKGYKTTKGGFQFPHDKPPPEALVRAIIRARVDENRSLAAAE